MAMTKDEIQAMVDGIVAASAIKTDAIGRTLDTLQSLVNDARARADAAYEAYENASGAEAEALNTAHYAIDCELLALRAAYEGAVAHLTAARQELADSVAFIERMYGVEIDGEYRVR